MPRKKPRASAGKSYHVRGEGSSSSSLVNAAPGRQENPNATSSLYAHRSVPHGSASAACSQSANTGYDAYEVMDPRIWSQLPEDMMVCVLAFLPVNCLLRFRAVCKKWDAMMFSRRFLYTRSQVHIQEPYFEFINLIYCRMTQQLSSYNPVSNTWHKMSMDFLPPHSGISVASSGGLLCFSAPREFGAGLSLVVCNPVTKSWRALPPRPLYERPMLVSIVAENRPPRYTVITAGMLSTEIFDSTTLSWRTAGSLPQETTLYPHFAYSAGSLFCLTQDSWSIPVLEFDLQQEVWSAVQTGRLPGQWQSRTLVGCKGSLFIVAKSARKTGISVCVWKLDQATRKWKEIATMPPSMSDRFFKRRCHNICCTGHGNLIFLTRDNCDQGALYNIERDSWVSVYKCHNLAPKDPRGFEPVLDVLEPSFATA
ncbi:hypothetical protein Mapa_010220 [Marchantia paleacea]|nr:hypothetical protein Mapa_010220 [Marchantia paleacea]